METDHKFQPQTMKTLDLSRPGDSKALTRAYFDMLLLEWRLLDATIPDTSVTLFGERFDTPVGTAALSHLGKIKENSGMYLYAEAAAMANTLHWVGMCENAEFEKLMNAGAKTVRVIKPYAQEDEIYSQIACAKEAGAIAVGMDIDHTFDKHGNPDVVLGEEMESKTEAQLRSYIEASGIPFVIKGILSLRDAARAAEIGAAGIVISHHGGVRLPYAVPPLMVLPEIAREVGNSLTIVVDCGICSGIDAYKALALGANAVSVGNHLIPYLKKGGSDAVKDRIAEMTAELKGAMVYTGVRNMEHFDSSVLHTFIP